MDEIMGIIKTSENLTRRLVVLDIITQVAGIFNLIEAARMKTNRNANR